MYQRLVFTLMTAVSLLGLYAVYSVVVRPVVVIPKSSRPTVEKKKPTDFELPDENRRVAIKYLPYVPWAEKSDLGLHSDQSFVYTNDWKPEPNNSKRVRFTPFAMASLSTDKDGKESAITMDSQAAILEFERDFDDKLKNPGRVVKAMFEGKTRIMGPNGLKIIGSNFIFDESTLNLWTTYPVHFQYLSHKGKACRMQMKLLPSPAPGPDLPHIYGVETIRLSGGSNPINPDDHKVVLSSAIPQGSEITPAVVYCDRDLLYTVATNTAVLEEGVVAKMGTKPKYTTLTCDKLTVKMVPKPPAVANAAPPPPSNYQKIDGDLEFSWLEAKGKRVSIDSSSERMNASMTCLTYTADTRRVWMSALDHPVVEQRFVDVDRSGSRLIAPEIEAILSPDRSSLSSLLCNGLGNLILLDEETRATKLKASWQRQLAMKKDEETNLDLIELHEKATFLQPDQATAIGADLIKIWLEKMDFKLNSSASNSGSSDSRNVQARKTPNPEPKRLLAANDVRLLSPRMVIKRANELDIRFEDLNERPAVSMRTRSRSRLQPAGLTVSGSSQATRMRSSVSSGTAQKANRSPQRQSGFANIPAENDRSIGPPVEIPSNPKNAPKLRSQKAQTPTEAPIVVSADNIKALMQQSAGNEEFKPREVHAQGNVEIGQDGKIGEKSMVLSGDTVDMHGDAENRDVIHVLGRPAMIKNPQMSIEGKDIRLNRGENHAWVEGSGKMDVLVPESTKIPNMDATANRNLHVWWNEKMDFDGLSAKFYGRVKAELGHGNMKCEQMTIQLAQRMSFDTQLENNDTKPALKTIRCQENVVFENSTHKDTHVIEVYRGRVGELLFDHTTGEADATGPGRVLVWRRQMKNGGGLATQDTIQANRPIPTEVTSWDFTQIKFEGRLKGTFVDVQPARSTRQFMTVDDRVEVIHGPVKRPYEEVDPDKLPSLGGTMRCEQLEITNHPISKRCAKPYFELAGRGNSEIEGQVKADRFTASADDITYDGSIGLYVLRAHGPRNARINGMANLSGKRIQFNPKLKTAMVNDATDGHASQ